jgi:hypothetical protein
LRIRNFFPDPNPNTNKNTYSDPDTVFQSVLRSRSWSRSWWSSNFLLEPEPKFFWAGSGSRAGYVNSYKMLHRIVFAGHSYKSIVLSLLATVLNIQPMLISRSRINWGEPEPKCYSTPAPHLILVSKKDRFLKMSNCNSYYLPGHYSHFQLQS